MTNLGNNQIDGVFMHAIFEQKCGLWGLVATKKWHKWPTSVYWLAWAQLVAIVISLWVFAIMVLH